VSSIRPPMEKSRTGVNGAGTGRRVRVLQRYTYARDFSIGGMYDIDVRGELGTVL
jgi:hypothetical protein